jgi:hypothetical protein
LEKRTVEELKDFNDEEIITYLKQYWGLSKDEPISVTGELSVGHISIDGIPIYSLNNVEFKNANIIEYPITDLNPNNYISKKGIYTPSNIESAIKASINDGNSIAVSCKLLLNYANEREKHDNPCELRVDAGSIDILHEIGNEYIFQSKDQRVFVKNSIVERHIIENTKLINEEIKKIENERNFIVNDTRLKREERQEDIERLTEQQNVLTENISLLDISIKEKEEHKQSILDELETLEILQNKEKEVMGAKLEKFRSFIKDKADNLLKLEFIEQEEYDELLMLKNEIVSNEPFIEFHEELNGDFAEAVSHIQAYLFQNDIVYPRYIIEDFFALVQTNDLIILAGESGSGKTNLIKGTSKNPPQKLISTDPIK